MMNLYDGYQYMEGDLMGLGNSWFYLFVCINFKSWYKVFDLSEFNFNWINEDFFKFNCSMFMSGQLADVVDLLE